MSDIVPEGLIEAVKKAAKKISENKRHISSEETTKHALINPILQALGWDTSNPNEVEYEYRYIPKDNPVDYALKLSEKPVLFLEAKCLGANLSDHDCILQVQNYANAAGVRWCVLSDGDQYRFFNANAPVDAEEKLFITITLSTDDPGYAAQMFSYISQGNLNDKELERLWREHFADRLVQAAMRAIVKEHDQGLVKLIQKRAQMLEPKEIAASLARLEITIAPMETTTTGNGWTGGTGTHHPTVHERFWKDLLTYAKTKTPLHANISPGDYNWLTTGAGISGLSYGYNVWQHEANVGLNIDRGKGSAKENQSILNQLAQHKADIERDFGGQLAWYEPEGARYRGIYTIPHIVGGYKDEDKWPQIHEAMVEAMIRFEKALAPHIQQLKVLTTNE